MSVCNGSKLLAAAPIVGMQRTKITQNGVSFGLTEAGYDIRIAEEIRFHPRLCHFSNSVIKEPHIAINENKFHYNTNFCLASAIEEFNMPRELMGVVHDKSTWARQGLSVFNTIIEPGWKGFLTLELVFNGTKDLIIPAGSGIAQVIFHELAQKASYNGKYQNQAAGPVPAKFE